MISAVEAKYLAEAFYKTIKFDSEIINRVEADIISLSKQGITSYSFGCPSRSVQRIRNLLLAQGFKVENSVYHHTYLEVTWS